MTNEEREDLIKDRDRLLDALDAMDYALLGDVKEFAVTDGSLNVDDAVQTYLFLREARERNKERADSRDKLLRDHQRRIENALHAFLQTNGTTGLNTKFGTVFTSQQSTARVADKDAFLSYLLDNTAWHLATVAANKAAVGKHLEENEGTLPPGVDWSSRIVVQIRRK
jgi:hypothetical protein